MNDEQMSEQDELPTMCPHRTYRDPEGTEWGEPFCALLGPDYMCYFLDHCENGTFNDCSHFEELGDWT